VTANHLEWELSISLKISTFFIAVWKSSRTIPKCISKDFGLFIAVCKSSRTRKQHMYLWRLRPFYCSFKIIQDKNTSYLWRYVLTFLLQIENHLGGEHNVYIKISAFLLQFASHLGWEHNVSLKISAFLLQFENYLGWEYNVSLKISGFLFQFVNHIYDENTMYLWRFRSFLAVNKA
jgi:hypothetical protein